MDELHKTPSVYVEELSAFPPSVVGVATAVPAFIGYSEKAIEPDSGRSLANLPARIASLTDYQALFGAGWAGDATKVAPILWESLAMFFGNGGGTCYVVSVGSFADFTADLGEAGLAPQRLHAGLDALARLSGPTLLVAPDALAMAEADYYPFACAMVNQGATLQDRFAILDVPGGRDPANHTPDLIEAVTARFRAGMLAGDARGYGASYFPYLDAVIGGNRRIMPASPAMAGLYADTDTSRGVWNPPANLSVAMVEGVTIPINDDEQAGLNMPVDGLAVNAIRLFAGRGVVVWGARTLDGNSNDYRYIQVRRTLIYIEQSIKAALQPFVFAANSPATWASVNAMISNFLTGLWQQGGLMGDKASDAFQVSIGLGSTMTAQDLLENVMRVSVELQMIHPAEFIMLDFMQQMAGSD
jgi:phage tail sheath protein FI